MYGVFHVGCDYIVQSHVDLATDIGAIVLTWTHGLHNDDYRLFLRSVHICFVDSKSNPSITVVTQR